MIQITPHMRILVAVEPVDFRGGIDGLAGLCRRTLREDPMSGTVFVFRNRSGTGIRLLVYDGQGFWLAYKRLSEGRFKHWPKGVHEPVEVLRAFELGVLLSCGDPKGVKAAPDWRSIGPERKR